MKPKKKKKEAALSASPENKNKMDPVRSGRRFLFGCLFPAFFLFCLFLVCLYAAGWAVWQAVDPASFPHEWFYPVHQIRVWSRHAYAATEWLYHTAGGKELPVERDKKRSVFRLEEPGTMPPVQWIIHEDYAEIVYPESMRDMENFTDRDQFLRRFYRDGVFKENRRLPAEVTYRAGLPVRIRMCPDGKGGYLFESFWIRDRKSAKGGMIPYSGYVLDDHDRAVLYQAGIKVRESAFPVDGYLRGTEGFRHVSKDALPLFLYCFTTDQAPLRDLLLKEKKTEQVLAVCREARWPNGELFVPEGLAALSIRHSDMELLNFLLRDSAALQELKSEKTAGAFTALHEAALQSDLKILTKIIPLYRDVHLREGLSGATPFLTSVMADRQDHVLLFLRRSDSQVNESLPDGSTALHLAVEICSPAIVKLLLLNQADRSRKNVRGETPLMLLRKKMKAEGLESDPAACEIRRMLE